MSRRPESPRPSCGALGAALLLLAAACGGGAEEPAPQRLRDDPRISPLFYDCANSGPYGRDTSDMLPILVEKLVDGQLEPLRRAKEELMGLGAPAAEELVRLMQEHFSAPLGAPYVQNVLDVLTAIDAPEVHPALMRALEHPTSEVRNRALRALADRGAAAEDYDRLRLHLDVEPNELKPLVAEALFRSDRRRAEAEFMGWVGEGSWEGLWRFFLPWLADTPYEETRAAASALYADAPPRSRVPLARIAAGGGDAGALAWLREQARSDDPVTRGPALAALGGLGESELLVEVLRREADPGLRILAAELLGDLELTEATRSALLGALDDEAPRVRASAATALLERGDPEAVERTLADLSSPSPSTVGAALDLLRDPMTADPGIAGAAFERLEQRAARESGRSFSARKRTLQVIGQVPHPDAARALLAAAQTIEEPEIDGLRPFRWCTLQAANTGERGQAVLVEAVASEPDPVRRIDLYWAIAARRNEAARACFLRALERPQVGEVETLYLASLLARLGPAERVARVLKQVALGIEEPAVRRAFNCLLWRWY